MDYELVSTVPPGIIKICGVFLKWCGKMKFPFAPLGWLNALVGFKPLQT